MAVYIELAVEDSQPSAGFRRSVEGRSRAGVSNVRRPLRGTEMKEDTYAVFRVFGADGKEIKLVDSSWEEGEGRGYANFLLQSVQEARMERQQILETFGAALVFFFGESPRFVDVNAVLLNTHDFNWEAEWWRNYQDTLRGTRLVEQGARALLCFDDTIIEGYPMNATVVKTSQDQNMVQLSFRMFVTNVANVSNVGDPNFPVHASASIPERLNERDDRTFAFQTETPAEANRRALGEYLKRLAVNQVLTEIANAGDIAEARRLQKQYALEQLGSYAEGANLLSLGKSFFQGVIGGATGQGQTLSEAKREFTAQAKKLLQLSLQGRTAEMQELLGAKENNPAGDLALSRGGGGSEASLTEALRNAIITSAPYPGQDYLGFLQRVLDVKFPGGVKQIIEAKRSFPLRSKIVDNYDEYTGVTNEQGNNIFEQRTGIKVGGETTDLPGAVHDAIETLSGASPTPANMYQAGMTPWSPTDGLRVNSTQPPNPTGRPLAPGTGQGFRYSYSNSWGSTSGAGGAYGGSLGGGIGAGVAGKAQNPSDLFGDTGFLPQGTQYGGGQGALPPNAAVLATGPNGEPLLTAQYSYGPTPGGTFFSGGPALEAVKTLNVGEVGYGVFGFLTVETP